MIHPLRGAVLDLGSNSFKLFLAEQRGATLVIHAEKVYITRLGEHVATTRTLQPLAIKRSLSAIKSCARLIRDFAPGKIFVSGTSALRTARNREAFTTPAQKILGRPIHILSGKKEGILGFAGICSHLRWARKKVISMDLGGGSLQFVTGEAGVAETSKSLPLGAVRMRDRFLHEHPTPPEALRQAHRLIQCSMKQNVSYLLSLKRPVLAVGGSITTLALMSQSEPGRISIPELEGFRVSRHLLQGWIERLSGMTLPQLQKIPGLPIERADLALPSALTFLTAMEFLGVTNLSCATRGLRYGIWLKMISGRPFSKILREETT